MKSKKAVSVLTAATLVAPAFASARSPMEDATTTGSAAVQKSTASEIALDQSTATLLSLIIATTKVERSAGKIVAVDPAVHKKYTYLRTAYLGGVPTSSVTIGATYLGVESVKKVEFVLKPLTLVLRAIQTMGKLSVEGIERFSIATGLDKVLEQSFDSSGKSVEYTYERVIRPVLQVLINKHTTLSSMTSSASASAAGSFFFMMNDSKEAMSVSQVRNILGQDQVIRTRIDAEVRGLSEIFNLNADQQSQLKIAIYDDIIRQAVANKFSEDSSLYNLDVIKLMADKNIVDRHATSAALEVRALIGKLTSSEQVDANTKELALQNADMALQLAALLESQLTTNNVKDPAIRADIERMLGSVSSKLALIGFNLKK
ncbi:hypothetical protein ACLVWU_13745 [Bdellovibrio sp. HCB290]|uniref:hypothetical protein n=1 Tax=Bdellovibrio sp. HCB290 TaxID=3394356 RepID=UPI0039B43D0F